APARRAAAGTAAARGPRGTRSRGRTRAAPAGAHRRRRRCAASRRRRTRAVRPPARRRAHRRPRAERHRGSGRASPVPLHRKAARVAAIAPLDALLLLDLGEAREEGEHVAPRQRIRILLGSDLLLDLLGFALVPALGGRLLDRRLLLARAPLGFGGLAPRAQVLEFPRRTFDVAPRGAGALPADRRRLPRGARRVGVGDRAVERGRIGVEQTGLGLGLQRALP